MASFMLEQSKGGKWDSKSFEQRFDNKADAEEYVRRIVTQWGITDPIRVVASADPPNCKMAGDIGDRHLEYLTPPSKEEVRDKILKALGDTPCITTAEIVEKTKLSLKTVADVVGRLRSTAEIEECSEEGKYRLPKREMPPPISSPHAQRRGQH